MVPGFFASLGLLWHQLLPKPEDRVHVMKCCYDLRGQFSNIYASFWFCTAGSSSRKVSSVSRHDVVMPTLGLLCTGLKPEQQAPVLCGTFPLVAPGREKMQGKKK